MNSVTLKSLDICVCLLIITPLAMLWWSATWNLISTYSADIHLRESWDSDFSSAVLSLLIGSLGCTIGNIILPTVIWRVLNPNNKKSLFIVRLYVYIFSLGQICFWRGLWNMNNIVTSESHGSYKYAYSYCVLGFAYVILFMLRTTSNTVGLPFAVSVDKISDFCQMPLCFGSKCSREDAGAFIADVLVSQLLVQTLVVEVWWSLWSITDQCLQFEQSALWANVIYSSTGYGLSLVLLLSSIPLKILSKKLHHGHRFLNYVYVVLIKMVATLSGLLIWKGIWQLLNAYVMSGTLWKSWVCHFAGFFGLLLLQVCSVLAPFGCVVDNVDDMEFEDCFPTAYFNRIPFCMPDAFSQIVSAVVIDEHIQDPTEATPLLNDSQAENTAPTVRNS